MFPELKHRAALTAAVSFLCGELITADDGFITLGSQADLGGDGA